MNAAYRGGWRVKPGGVRVPDLTVETEWDEPAVDWGDYQTDPVADLIDEIVWSDADLRKAHAAYVAGKRDVWTVAGHKEWDRLYRARKRLEARLDPETLAWAESAAEAHFWASYEVANRAGGSETLQRIAENKVLRGPLNGVR